MTVYEIAQEFLSKYALAPLGALLKNPDGDAVQILALLHEELRDLSLQTWQEAKIYKEFSPVGPLVVKTLFPGFLSIVPNTVFDMTLKLPLQGPVSDHDWQYQKNLLQAGPFYRWRISQGLLEFLPLPYSPLSTISLYYNTKALIRSSDEIPQEMFQADTDFVVVEDNLVISGLEWRWLKLKELEWQSAYQRYTILLGIYAAKSGSKPILRLDSVNQHTLPGIYIPSGGYRAS